jgi:cytochrome c-type biogenesis protein CcmE
MRRYRAFVIPAAGLILVLGGFMFANLQENLVYYRVPAEVAGAPAEEGRFRLGGQVVPGTVAETDGGVDFEVSDGDAVVMVSHTGAPQQLFREGIGVVVEGAWNGEIFRSDSMIIKHDEQYRTEDGGVYTPDNRPGS